MMPPESFERPSDHRAGRAGVTDREMQELYDHGEMAEMPAPRSGAGRVVMIIVMIALVAAAAYGVWWIVTDDGPVINSAVPLPVAFALRS